MHTTRHLRLWPLALLAACSLLLAACGTNDDDPGPAPDTGDDTDVLADAEGDTDADTDDTADTADTDTVEPIDLRIAGLDGPVQAVYDEFGLLHLQCVSDADCVAALGYFHAANRFFFMDFTRLNVRGQLGHAVALEGDIADALLAEDIRQRHFMTTVAGDPLEQVMVDGLAAPEAELLQRYTEGVNTWLADARAGRNGARLQDEYGLGLLYGSDPATRADKIRDWEPADSMAVALSMFDQLANQSGSEIVQGQTMAALAGLDAELVGDILSQRQAFPVATMPASGETFGNLDGADMIPRELDLEDIQGVGERLARNRAVLDAIFDELVGPRPGLGAGAEGSNNWVVSPSRTASGNPLLANDPHLALYNPSLWFVTELDSKTAQGATGTFHVAGGTFPGLPVFLLGHTESIAWGVTTAYWDLADVYTETLTPDGSAVEFDGGTVDILEKDFEFMTGGMPTTRTLRWVPHHGPIVSEDAASGTALSVRWTLHDGSASNDIAGFFGMMRAATLAEAETAISNIHGANQNFVVIDKDGEIGWFPWVRLPQRPWDWSVAPPWLPLPGDGSAEWGPEPFPVDELPSMRNPTNGFIATANQDHTGAYLDGDPSENDGQAQIFGRALGVRMQRIVDQLEAGGNDHDVDSMLELQGDTYMLLGEVVAPALLAAADGNDALSAEARAVVDALQPWDYTCPTGLAGTEPDAEPSADAAERTASIGCAAFHVTLFEVLKHALDDEAATTGVSRVTASGLWQSSALRMVVASLERPDELSSGDAFWDDITTTDVTETRDDILSAALESAAVRLHRDALDGDDPGLGDDPSQWLWGRIHTVSLRSPYNTFSATFTGFNDGPWANDGGLLTVDVANPADRDGLDFWHGSGASIRIVVELRDEGPVMLVQHPGGTSLFRNGPRYSQLLQRYLTNTPIEMPFGLSAIENAQETLEVSPQ